MIIVNLKGGLGNQMFQYAFGRNLALKNNTDLRLDISALDQAEKIGNIYRPFSLDLFNIKNELASTAEIINIKKPVSLAARIKRRVVNTIWGDQTNLFKKNYLEQTGNQYLDGYWQSALFFEGIREILLQEFSLKNPLPEYGEKLISDIRQTSSVSIHVRHGDYIKNPLVHKQFGACSAKYYKQAVDKIAAAVPKAKFFVFSDDIEWVMNNLELPSNTVFASNPILKDAEELILMSSCQHNIIANSSFSWWAGYLNQNPDKMVVAPTPWFDTIKYDKDLLPTSWIQITK